MKNKVIFFLLVLLITNIACGTTLEEQFEGMKTCDQMGKLKDMNFDQYHEQVSSAMPYIIERKLQPCELNELANYCINDTFYGLEVDKISIPYTMSIYAIHFKDDLETVRKKLDNYMEIIKFDPTIKAPKQPSLIVDQNDNKKSILFCDFYDE